MADGARTMPVSTITAATAREVVTAAAAKATEIGAPMCIAVTDHAGELKAFLRMDGAPQLAVGIAQDKAYTATAWGMRTAGWWDFIKEDPPLLHGIVKTDRLVVFDGGYPIKDGDEVIGGLGVSGGHYSQDGEVARAGIERTGLVAG